MVRDIKWGILGYAGIARSKVIPAMMNAAHTLPYGIASRSEEKLREAAEWFGFRNVYHTYEELLADPEIDAVYIPLPNALHKEWVIKAACAGKHILCEKPLALTAADVNEMIQICEAQGVKLMEAFMYRFAARGRVVRELLEDGVIGEIRHINSSHRFLLEDMDNVRVNAALGGGSLWDVGCYPINLTGWLLDDEPEQIRALKTMVQGVDLAVSAVLKYRNGVMASIHSGFDSCSSQVTEIDGTKGSMIIRDSFIDMDGRDTPIQVILADGSCREYPLPPCRQYQAEVEELSLAIIENRAPGLKLDESLRNIRLMEAILEEANDTHER